MKPDPFFTLFSDLPQEGPGSRASTLEAIRRLPALPDAPRVLDLGCGSGRQTLILASTLATTVVAIDLHQPYLDQLTRAARQAGLSERILTRCLSMDALDYPEESVDLIWCEGAAYILGVERALRLWRPLLRPAGVLALTEASWLTDTPPPEVAAFWEKAYPLIDTVAGNCGTAEVNGFTVHDTFILPARDWWADYYTPLQNRMAELSDRAADWPELAQVMEETRQEIDLFARCGDSYGYVFYILRKTGAGRV